MTDDYKRYLIDGDPVAREPELDAFHVQTMRQRVLLEAQLLERSSEREDFGRASWLRPLAVAGALAACLVAGVAFGLRMNEPQPLAPAVVTAPAVRQMQFETPGGTRIIWTFHQDLDL